MTIMNPPDLLQEGSYRPAEWLTGVGLPVHFLKKSL